MLNTGKLYFSYDPVDGLALHDTADEARARAEGVLEDERDHSTDGWSEYVEEICWGEVSERVTMTERRPVTEEDGRTGIDEIVNYELRPVERSE